MRIFKRVLLVLFGLAVIAGLVFASLPDPLDVDTAPVVRGSLRVTVDGDGKTRVQDRYLIAAPLYGNLARIELEPGDDVEEETVLARITPLRPPLLDARSKAELEARVKATAAASKQASAAADRAKTAAKYAENQLTEARQLQRRGTLSAHEVEATELEARHAAKTLESARFGVRVSRHELEMAEAALGRAKGKSNPEGEVFQLTSGVNGRVLRILRQSEGVVSPGEPVLELGDPARLEIVVDVLTEDAVEIEPGDAVLIERWGGPEPLHGGVVLVEPSAFTKISALGVEEQRVNVVIDIQEPPDVWQRLGDGFRVEVQITVWEADELLKVPMGALHRRGEAWAVYVVEDAIVHEREIEIGRRSGLEVEVVQGLEAGETLVVYPSDAVVDGVEVAVR